ncbi:MAG: hypothetical protein R3264_03290 [Anaerolineae bacterium]|nr:hypothetical protein [Anaerolineae bacterium]
MGTSRPSMQSVQRSLLIGILAGVLFGCILGTVFGTYYAWQVNPAVYSDGAFPSDLTNNYQDHYIATVVDSYTVNRNVEVANERLKTFDPTTQVRALGRRSADFVANGQAVEAQLVNELALNLKNQNAWSDEAIQGAISQLSTEYQSQGDTARSQAVNTFSADLLDGAIPVPAPETDQGPDTEPDTAAEPPAQEAGGGFPWTTILTCLLVLLVIGLIIYLVGRWRFASMKSQPRHQVEWEGEGPAPIRIWSGTYQLGQNNYDEFFTIETPEGDFLGESGMGIMKSVPGTDPKQVTAFDVGLFDKTDITTLSRVVMSEDAYHNDEDLRANVDSNPMAEAVLAEPGKEFTLETSAMRVQAKIDEMEYAEESKSYFSKLKITLNVFVKEGADLRIGEMDVPEQFQG